MTQPTGNPTPPTNGPDPGTQNSPPTPPTNNPAPTNDPPTPPQNQPPINQPPPANDPAVGRDDSAARIAELEAQLNQTKEEGEKWKIILDKLGAVLNPDQQQTPEQLAEALKQRDEELKERNLELAVYSVAGAQAGSTLLDSRRFRDSIKGMEPGTDAFTAKITEAVGKLSPTQTAPPGTPSKGAGADLGGGKGGDGNAQLTKEQMEGMTHKEIMAAYRAGQFNDLIKAK